MSGRQGDPFAALQQRLGPVWELNQPGQTGAHVTVVLPSFGVTESLLSHYADRLPALEHRYLVAILALVRLSNTHLVFVTCQDPGRDVVDYYLDLLPADHRADAAARLTVFEVPDMSHRSVASKLLDRPDLIEALKAAYAGRPALLEPWNVTENEQAVALALDTPINGTPPELWPIGFKSAGRKLFREVGVPVAYGYEDLRSVDVIVETILNLRRERPEAVGVVVKLDDSGAGDGNAVIDLHDLPPGLGAGLVVRQRLAALADWYVRDIPLGCVVEERIAGDDFTSPSVTVDISPLGDVSVACTHEQVLGGDHGQVYTGCRFPARSEYAPELAQHGRAVGQALAERGVIGRFGVDFVTARTPDGTRTVAALEMNLRKGGTTHPFAVLHNLVPTGSYDADAGTFVDQETGSAKVYESTDNLLDPGWTGMTPRTAIAAVREAGLAFDRERKTGVVLHMLNCLAIDGRVGVTAIGHDQNQIDELTVATTIALSKAAAR